MLAIPETATQIQKPTERCFPNPGTGTPGYWHKLDRWTDRGIDGIVDRWC